MKDLILLIRNDAHDTWEALCVHNTTHEVYVVRGKNTFFGDIQCGGRMESTISSITKATPEEAALTVSKEFNYLHLYTYQIKCRTEGQSKMIIDQRSYRIEYFVVIDNIEVPQNQIMFGKSDFRVPAHF